MKKFWLCSALLVSLTAFTTAFAEGEKIKKKSVECCCKECECETCRCEEDCASCKGCQEDYYCNDCDAYHCHGNEACCQEDHHRRHHQQDKKHHKREYRHGCCRHC